MFEFGIIGGDMRSVFLAQALEARGHRVLCALLDRERPCCPPEEALAADRLILPMPPVRGGFLNAPLGSRSLPAGELAARTAGRIVYAGGAFPGAVNYATDAWLVRQNAAVTAEAAAPHYAALARRTVRGSRIAVAGFGRVGQAVAVLFHAMGADIRVAARRQAVREQAAALGFSVCTMEELPGGLSDRDGLINTVPAAVIGEREIGALPAGSVILDLASAPGGVDFAAALRHGIPAELALALPGRYAPATAGELLAEVIERLCREEKHD